MAYKCVLLLLAGALVASLASPLDYAAYYGMEERSPSDPAPVLSRQVRSPQHGSVNIEYTQDRFGKRGTVQYNHNLHTSSDGRFKVDAYGQASRDFTHNRNDHGGGVVGSWRF